jgi:hypothetical protein
MDLNDHLNRRFAIWTTIVWTVSCGVAIYFNGGLGAARDPIALLVMTVLCGAMLFFSLGPIVSERMRQIVLKPGTDLSVVRKELWITIVIAAVLFVGCGVSLVRQLPI